MFSKSCYSKITWIHSFHEQNTYLLILSCFPSLSSTANPTTQPESVKTQKKNEKVYEFSFDNLPGTDRITHFDVQIRNTVTDKVVVSSTKRHTILSGNVVRFQWDGVEAGNQYEIRFRGVNPAGTGPWSEPIKFGASECFLYFFFNFNFDFDNNKQNKIVQL